MKTTNLSSRFAIDVDGSALRFRKAENIETIKRSLAVTEKGKERMENYEPILSTLVNVSRIRIDLVKTKEMDLKVSCYGCLFLVSFTEIFVIIQGRLLFVNMYTFCLRFVYKLVYMYTKLYTSIHQAVYTTLLFL